MQNKFEIDNINSIVATIKLLKSREKNPGDISDSALNDVKKSCNDLILETLKETQSTNIEVNRLCLILLEKVQCVIGEKRWDILKQNFYELAVKEIKAWLVESNDNEKDEHINVFNECYNTSFLGNSDALLELKDCANNKSLHKFFYDFFRNKFFGYDILQVKNEDNPPEITEDIKGAIDILREVRYAQLEIHLKSPKLSSNDVPPEILKGKSVEDCFKVPCKLLSRLDNNELRQIKSHLLNEKEIKRKKKNIVRYNSSTWKKFIIILNYTQGSISIGDTAGWVLDKKVEKDNSNKEVVSYVLSKDDILLHLGEYDKEKIDLFDMIFDCAAFFENEENQKLFEDSGKNNNNNKEGGDENYEEDQDYEDDQEEKDEKEQHSSSTDKCSSSKSSYYHHLPLSESLKKLYDEFKSFSQNKMKLIMEWLDTFTYDDKHICFSGGILNKLQHKISKEHNDIPNDSVHREPYNLGKRKILKYYFTSQLKPIHLELLCNQPERDVSVTIEDHKYKDTSIELWKLKFKVSEKSTKRKDNGKSDCSKYYYKKDSINMHLSYFKKLDIEEKISILNHVSSQLTQKSSCQSID